MIWLNAARSVALSAAASAAEAQPPSPSLHFSALVAFSAICIARVLTPWRMFSTAAYCAAMPPLACLAW